MPCLVVQQELQWCCRSYGDVAGVTDVIDSAHVCESEPVTVHCCLHAVLTCGLFTQDIQSNHTAPRALQQ